MSISINNVGLTSAYSSLLSSSSRSSSSSGSSIQEVFDALDTNKDGVVSAAELAAAGKSSSSSSSSSDSGTGAFLSQSDSNGDGSLSLDEFSSGVKNVEKQLMQALDQMKVNGGMPPPPGGAQGGGASDEQLGRVFDKLDTNKDGTVSAAELAAAKSDSSSGSDRAGLSDLLSQSDSDGDGSLSLAEFKAGAQKAQGAASGQMPPPPPESAQAGQNESIDKLQQLLASLGVSTGASTQGSSVSVVA